MSNHPEGRPFVVVDALLSLLDVVMLVFVGWTRRRRTTSRSPAPHRRIHQNLTMGMLLMPLPLSKLFFRRSNEQISASSFSAFTYCITTGGRMRRNSAFTVESVRTVIRRFCTALVYHAAVVYLSIFNIWGRCFAVAINKPTSSILRFLLSAHSSLLCWLTSDDTA